MQQFQELPEVQIFLGDSELSMWILLNKEKSKQQFEFQFWRYKICLQLICTSTTTKVELLSK